MADHDRCNLELLHVQDSARGCTVVGEYGRDEVWHEGEDGWREFDCRERELMAERKEIRRRNSQKFRKNITEGNSIKFK